MHLKETLTGDSGGLTKQRKELRGNVASMGQERVNTLDSMVKRGQCRNRGDNRELLLYVVMNLVESRVSEADHTHLQVEKIAAIKDSGQVNPRDSVENG